MLTTDQSERYELHIVVEMQVLDGRQIQGNARAEARRSLTVAEDSSLKEREEVWYRLTEQTMRDLDQQLEKTIREAFFPYIVLSPAWRSEEHTSELQSLMSITYAVFCLKKTKTKVENI